MVDEKYKSKYVLITVCTSVIPITALQRFLLFVDSILYLCDVVSKTEKEKVMRVKSSGVMARYLLLMKTTVALPQLARC